MKITVNDHKKVLETQQEFSNVFPYLRMDIFSKSKPLTQILKQHETEFGDLVSAPDKLRRINITAEMSVASLMNSFSELYGLGVQVFRKSGKAWIGTSLTKEWTLKEQNLQGEALSNKFV
jgi:hypothetical protein